MTLVVIKLGGQVYNGGKEDEGYALLRFLNTIMYPHKEDCMDTVSEYIDYSENEELWKEVKELSTIEEIKYEGMREELEVELREELGEELREELEEELREELEEELEEKLEKAKKEAKEEGIQAMILENFEEQIPKERILKKLQKYFKLTEEKAEQYYRQFIG